MEKRIYDYIAACPLSNHHEIAKALQLPELETMKRIRLLRKADYLRLFVVPIIKESGCSHFYFAGKKKIEETNRICRDE